MTKKTKEESAPLGSDDKRQEKSVSSAGELFALALSEVGLNCGDFPYLSRRTPKSGTPCRPDYVTFLFSIIQVQKLSRGMALEPSTPNACRVYTEAAT